MEDHERGGTMPELPEVETMVRGLRPALVGRTIGRLEVHDPFLLQGCTAEEIERRGRRCRRGGDERGKWVVIAFGGDRGSIVIQPRMTGGLCLVPPKRPEHVRLTFALKRPGKTASGSPTPRRLGKVARGIPTPGRPRPLWAGRTARMPWSSPATSLPRGLRLDVSGGSADPDGPGRSWPASGISTRTRPSSRPGSTRSGRHRRSRPMNTDLRGSTRRSGMSPGRGAIAAGGVEF